MNNSAWIALLLSGCSSALTAQPQFEVIDIGLPPGCSSPYPAAINNSGNVVVDCQGTAFFWTPAAGFQPVPPLPGETFVDAVAMNNMNSIVGLSSVNGSRAFIWRPFTGSTELGALPGITA